MNVYSNQKERTLPFRRFFSLCTKVLLCSFIFVHTTVAQSYKPNQSAVVSAHPLATQAGQQTLAKGGNAFDAAVTVSSMLGVVEPFGSGIGGGAFWLIYQAKTDRYFVIDAREVAPLAAHADMYLDNHGNVLEGASTSGPLAAGIPGLPAAWVDINNRLGTLPLKNVLGPAIKMAQEGFPVDERYIAGASYKISQLRQNSDAASIFLDNNNVPEKGWNLIQNDLAQTVSLIAEKGMSGFYGGDIAQALVTDVRKHGGIWSLEDLSQYSVIEREPVLINYKGAKIIAPPLPSSGGLVLKNIFNILSGYNLENLSATERKHLIIEAMRHGYHNRALHMGDSDFVPVPTDKITSLEMVNHQRSLIFLDKATPSATLSAVKETKPKGTETTHFSIIDSQGNMVAVTQSINFWFGSGFVAKGTGVLLNNEMDDFTMKPGVANGYGLVGTKANAIAPKKRMLSSMTPVFVMDKNKRAILGTPGGSRIISMNLLAILSFLDGMSGEDIVSMPRYHHQFLPDKVIYETGAFTKDEFSSLQQKGHNLLLSPRQYGNMQMIIWNYKNSFIKTYSDPRGDGTGRVY
ncbi:MAG: gamma-glutamyltransferase [Zetaproteobacteria bacterium]|nr:MAG: gamma-glutamyltransferase [Zetaproteobacteria bacterium]